MSGWTNPPTERSILVWTILFVVGLIVFFALNGQDSIVENAEWNLKKWGIIQKDAAVGMGASPVFMVSSTTQ